MKKKACKQCKLLVSGNECPNCKSTDFSINWQGRIFIIDPMRSKVAEKISMKVKGEYAIKVR